MFGGLRWSRAKSMDEAGAQAWLARASGGGPDHSCRRVEKAGPQVRRYRSDETGPGGMAYPMARSDAVHDSQLQGSTTAGVSLGFRTVRAHTRPRWRTAKSCSLSEPDVRKHDIPERNMYDYAVSLYACLLNTDRQKQFLCTLPCLRANKG